MKHTLHVLFLCSMMLPLFGMQESDKRSIDKVYSDTPLPTSDAKRLTCDGIPLHYDGLECILSQIIQESPDIRNAIKFSNAFLSCNKKWHTSEALAHRFIVQIKEKWNEYSKLEIAARIGTQGCIKILTRTFEKSENMKNKADSIVRMKICCFKENPKISLLLNSFFKAGIVLDNGFGFKTPVIHLSLLNTDIFPILHAHGADLHARDYMNLPLITKAVSGRLTKLVAQLIAVDGHTSVPLDTLMEIGLHENVPQIVELLLKAGANPNAPLGIYKDAPLMRAQTTEMVELLLTYHADITYKNSKGQTPLQVAQEIFNHRRNSYSRTAAQEYERIVDLLQKKQNESSYISRILYWTKRLLLDY